DLVALNRGDHFLHAAERGRRAFQNFCFPALRFRVARIHAEKLRGEERGFVAAGSGGDEAALFAAELFRMYSRYAETQGWKAEVLESSPSSLGGMKEVVAAIQGNKVYSKLKYESGVHRVQRVPATEQQGRVHTSAATVVVLPEAEELDVDLKDSDIEIATARSG